MFKCPLCPYGKVEEEHKLCLNCNTVWKSTKDPIAIGLRKQVIDHFGGKCKKCKEDRLGCLDLDHVNGDGAEHRANLRKQKYKGYKGAYQTYRWLIDNNFKCWYKLQVLCRNCHSKKHTNKDGSFKP